MLQAQSAKAAEALPCHDPPVWHLMLFVMMFL